MSTLPAESNDSSQWICKWEGDPGRHDKQEIYVTEITCQDSGQMRKFKDKQKLIITKRTTLKKCPPKVLLAEIKSSHVIAAVENNTY